MISEAQKALSARTAAHLREWADMLEDVVSEDAAVRGEARKRLESEMGRRPWLETERLTAPGNSLLYDYCPHCGGETDDCDDYHAECASELRRAHMDDEVPIS